MDAERSDTTLKYAVKDPQALASNLARLVEEAGKALSAYLGPREKGEKRDELAAEIADIVRTLTQVSEYWLSDPQRTLEAQTRLWSGYINLWASSMRRMMGDAVEPAAAPDPRDKRFQDPEWSKNQFFDFCKQIYLITARWAEQLVLEARDVDPHTRHKAEFYVRQIANALSPSNFILTNPELLRETLESNGANLVRGMQMLAEDIRAGGGDLKIRQTDPTRFAVGKNLATTPGKVVLRNEICEVIQYEATTRRVMKRPLVVVPPWINKFYVLDLTPEKSFIRWCVEQGLTVFVISWVNPDRRLAKKSFEHYMREGLLEATRIARKITGEKTVNAIGYCVGGTLLAVTLAWLAARGDRHIHSATLFTAQVDFTHAGDLKVFVDEEQVATLERHMDERGFLEGQKMANAFNLLRSNDLIWPYVVNNYLRGRDPFPFDLLYWNADSTRLPAANHSFYLRHCYLNNDLAAGRLEIGGHRLDLKKVKVPIYNLATREDHIAPAKSVFVGSRCFGGDVTYVLAGSGHIAGVINPPARNKYQYWVDGPPEGAFEDWLARAEERPGSWWPHWLEWLRGHSKATAPARTVGGGVVKTLGDAPGRYVVMKA